MADALNKISDAQVKMAGTSWTTILVSWALGVASKPPWPPTQSTEPHRQASNEGREDSSNLAELGTSVQSEDASQSQPAQVTSTGRSGGTQSTAPGRHHNTRSRKSPDQQ
ncbi:hypothetical protein SPBR_06270 [Sporothrix brasiliensis 5110]|uniref:Uncharacterized protein n=1 Tax=Sporothrix brasiliensis 5110 TaxID=1398154 RepID=A0A0C2FS20_9PEZI|nr:uncharacterized protein SPBR_06270 [Sporothrix brasiliensis 5110]KIH93818.1 hypothetical protein SPBR_06270 [Sporothrix brasiliensis 5110]